mgnify:FL=1
MVGLILGFRGSAPCGGVIFPQEINVYHALCIKILFNNTPGKPFWSNIKKLLVLIDYKGTYEKIAFVAFSVLWIFVSSLCPTSFKTELGCAKGPNEISCVNVWDPWSKWLLGSGF